MPKILNKLTLFTLFTLNKMSISKLAKDTFIGWREDQKRSGPAMFEAIVRHGMKTGFSPEERENALLTLNKMIVSEPAKTAFTGWRDTAQRPGSVIFEDLVNHAMATGFNPGERDNRQEPIETK